MSTYASRPTIQAATDTVSSLIVSLPNLVVGCGAAWNGPSGSTLPRTACVLVHAFPEYAIVRSRAAFNGQVVERL